MKNTPKTLWQAIAAGFASIGQGMSTFTLWPDTDYEEYAKDLRERYSPGQRYFAGRDKSPAPKEDQATASTPRRKRKKQARWKKRR